jgi:AraC-like DNA-binding protein
MGQPRNGHKTSPATIEAKERAARALELRKTGETFATIAQRVGYRSQQAAHDAVRRALDEVLREPAEQLRALELERLEALWRAHYSNALAGDLPALAACLKLMERRARLLGLDKAPPAPAVQLVAQEAPCLVLYPPGYEPQPHELPRRTVVMLPMKDPRPDDLAPGWPAPMEPRQAAPAAADLAPELEPALRAAGSVGPGALAILAERADPRW